MLNNRDLELQSIIKIQQSKIHSLKQELTLALKNEQGKINEAISMEKKIIQEKDKMIAFLMEEGKKQNLQVKQQSNWKSNQFKEDYKKAEETNLKLKVTNNQLQSKLVQMKSKYQLVLTSKQKELVQITNKLNIIQKQRKNILDEIQKLNRFYVSAIRKQPEREETLLWVDKLIDFMSKTSQIVANESKQRQQAILNITRHLTEELKQLNIDYTKNDTIIVSQRSKFLEEMHKMIQKTQNDCNQAKISNQEFWENLSKVRIKQQKQYVTKLQNQLKIYRQTKQKEIQSITETLTTMEKQKKSLLVSLQELKSYYQLKEKANREQIDFLKKTIQDLLQTQQLRQNQFQKQIKKMEQTIQHLKEKFYSKIDMPNNSIYLKIKQEVQVFKNQFDNFYSTSSIQTQIGTFQTTIVQYLMILNQQKDLKETVKEAAKTSIKIAQFLNSYDKVVQSQTAQRFKRLSSMPINLGSSSEMAKEVEQKLTEELVTARKHIQMLKDHSKQLQAKHPHQKGSAPLLNSKIIQLTAENEALKQKLQKMERNQKDKTTYDQQMLQQAKIGRVNTGLLEQLAQKCQTILQFITQEEQYIISLFKCINSLNLIVLNPADTFQQLISHITNISALDVFPPGIEVVKTSTLLVEMQAKRQTYRDILFRKHQAGLNVQKTSLQLMKLVREFLSKCSSNKHSKISEIPVEDDKPKAGESRTMFQKRMKEVHTQKLKIRQQMLQKLYFLQQKVKNIDQRSSKKQNFSFNKFQQSLCKKFEQFLTPLIPKIKQKDANKITQEALADTQSKLKDCFIQNQGLLKEIEMLKLIISNK